MAEASFQPQDDEPERECRPVPPEGPRGLRALFKNEDYWAIWLGFTIIAVGLLIFLPRPPENMKTSLAAAEATMEAEAEAAPFKTIAWYKASDAKASLKATSEPYAKTINKWITKPHGWKENPIDSLVMTEEEAREKQAAQQPAYEAAQERTAQALAEAEAKQEAAREAGFDNKELNQQARQAIAAWRDAKNADSALKKKTSVKPYNQAGYLIALGVALALFFSIGIRAMGHSWPRFIAGFFFVFVIAVLAYMMANQSTMKSYGIGYAAWAIGFGLLISNTVGTPQWVMPAVQTEYYIKTGLVLLGAEILFGKILAIGTPGIFVAWIVTPIVLVTTYIFGQKILKIPSKTLNVTISADMSVCGVSAAIATAAACRAKKEELTLAVGMSLIFTSIMMIVMPNIINGVGMDHVLGGAWMGGTIDATGAVAAAGAFLSDRALHVAATIKMIQNVLIGVVAFCVAFYWCARVDRQQGVRVGAGEIWVRFPKFVLGFIAASILFSILYQNLGQGVGYALIDNGVLRGFTKIFRGWFFCLAFVSIGLATNFRALATYFKGGKPLILYACGQTFNLCFTLVMAYIMFFIVFPEIAARI